MSVEGLLALGRHDCEVPPSLWERVAAKLPDLTVEVFERRGHPPFFDAPERFTDAVMEWMANRD